MIRVRNLLVQRPAGILCRLASLDVERGERISVEGPNGSGKSTLLRVLAGLERDFEGDVDVAARGRDATFVHQTPLLFRGTVLANVLYGLRARHVPRRDALRRAQEMLERAELSTLANRRVAGLSGGERRRVALARAFVLEPQLLLLDEPLSDLDDAGARMLGRALDAALSATVLLTSPTGETGALAQRRITLTR